MSSINDYMYGSLGTNNSYVSQLYSPANSKYRGGVTGWEHSDKNSKTGSAYSSSALSSKAGTYVSSLKEFGGKILNALDSLSGKNQTAIFDLLKATSSDSDAFSVKADDQDKALSFLNAGNEKKTLEISQLASAQKNSGTMHKSAEISTVKSGGNSFAITKGGKEYNFNVNVNKTDSNRTVQEKMAEAINKEDAGINATVVYNEKDKTSSLVLTSKETGAAEAFEIKDVSGNAVSAMGVNNTTTTAKDARYTLDGYEQSSASNEVDLGDGITATFKKVTKEEAEVTVGGDTEDITNAVYDLVNGFNQLRETALNASDDSGAKRLLDRLDSTSSAYMATLNRAGISYNENGYLQIDKGKLAESIESGEAEKIFGEDSGFTRSLSAIAKQSESDPASFLSAKGRTGEDEDNSIAGLNLDDLYSTTNFSPFQSAQLMRWENTSFLLDAMI